MMLSRSLRPLTTRVTNLAINPVINPVRPSALLGPLSLRTFADTADVTTTSKHRTVPSTIPSAKTAPRQLPYYVGRNNLNNLGVYQKRRRGGNYKLTLLKYAEGDLAALKQDIRFALRLQYDEIAINSVTNHIVIKGHKRDEVVNFLYTMGF
ncbi:mitochondrial large subunit ribosomal protein-domain-containing protein [Xylaria venustula]|nr:mitochondrial large subunit ribosomal protein-domain-containing protein [Xylaria venustula]